jgi:3-phenylpropionate/cinnamic acid dioxygenase small subunit
MNAYEETELLAAVTRREQPRRTPEAQLDAAEDRETIRDLIMRYGYLEDARRWDDMLALYTDDIERVLAGSLVERVQGKAALRERLFRPVMVSTAGQAGAAQDELDRLGLRHLMASDVIRLSDDGTHAVAAVQYTMVATRDDEHGFRRGSHEGSYVFEFRKEAGTWKFSRQVIITDNAHNPMFRR